MPWLLFLIAGVVYAKDYEVNKKAGDYNVLIKIDKNPPIAGENNLEIAITDASGKAVTDAKVAVQLLHACNGRNAGGELQSRR